MTIDFWDRSKTLLNQRLRKQKYLKLKDISSVRTEDKACGRFVKTRINEYERKRMRSTIYLHY